MIRGFVEIVGNVGVTRLKELVDEGTVESYYVMVGPDRDAAVANILVWNSVPVPKWGWYVCTADQDADVADIAQLDQQLEPIGWCLNIEKVLEGAKLDTLIAGVSALGKPMVASLAGITSSHVEFDYRTLDRFKVAVDWQSYFDSGEGTTPQKAVQELHQSSFIIAGREYRIVLGGKYGWGRIVRVEANQRAVVDSYQRPGIENAYLAVTEREWGHTVVARTLWRNDQSAGALMGKAAYANIRVTLDTTRTAQSRPANEWTPIAASARANGANRRPCSVYLVEHSNNDVLRAIAAGSG